MYIDKIEISIYIVISIDRSKRKTIKWNLY